MITAAIVNYNRAEYLGKCIEQFQKQKHLSEIIVVDDCSTDSSKEIADRYNVRWIQTKENSGDPWLPNNMIIEKVNTPYFYWLASDDWVSNDCFEVLYNHIVENESDYVYSAISVTNEQGDVKETWNLGHKQPDEMVYHIFNTGGSGFMPIVGLYRTEFMKEIGYIRSNGVESDVLNTLNYLKHNIKYQIVPIPLVYYRQHKKNNSKNIQKRVKRVVEIMKFIYYHFDERIYFPQVEWSVIKDITEFRPYMMGTVFYNLYKAYTASKLPPYLQCGLSQEELAQISQPFLDESEKFLQEALQKKGVYSKEIQNCLLAVNKIVTS